MARETADAASSELTPGPASSRTVSVLRARARKRRDPGPRLAIAEQEPDRLPVYSAGADFVLAGMYDWQIAEDVKIAREAPANRKRSRPRPETDTAG